MAEQTYSGSEVHLDTRNDQDKLTVIIIIRDLILDYIKDPTKYYEYRVTAHIMSKSTNRRRFLGRNNENLKRLFHDIYSNEYRNILTYIPFPNEMLSPSNVTISAIELEKSATLKVYNVDIDKAYITISCLVHDYFKQIYNAYLEEKCSGIKINIRATFSKVVTLLMIEDIMKSMLKKHLISSGKQDIPETVFDYLTIKKSNDGTLYVHVEF